mmetsp:Transcript_52151/g.110996  ORF Transcript_52151/g.110996 Transcript_52151/m.110996 type:complete len:391 (-) Transcript_52151:63-1235(-)|eukprot:CAMPEP_0206444258 /NCGR_PEP_ID=MMETSP0324_2-20121206/14814_1 /ASSEMBLY_ACC=CAM_ASM_000836 /TAXON_ID=2866 /ORGANISM="Crypthecodinium cohnii, Strain Seligo" /LENGTH=390 /DNA_ID=CAMNT_0053912265 /DNA_START=182 /DNA_END=1354 /DNA_ORIENTATION=-
MSCPTQSRRVDVFARHIVEAPHRPTSDLEASLTSSPGGFRAWVVDADNKKGKLKSAAIKEFQSASELPLQDPKAKVTIRVQYSDLNYKDAMILDGQKGLCKSFPIVPGIDCAGVVESSDSDMWKPGDRVVVTGNKIGQHFDGGLSGICRVKPEWCVSCPDNFTTEQCMILGTAGFTAMQMIIHMEDCGMTLDHGPAEVLVTGAAGGVGSTAIALLSRMGYKVVASTSRVDSEGDFLRKLGATEVIGRLQGDGRKQPLQSQRWMYAVDCVGGPTLSTILAQMKHLGIVSAVGVAGGGLLDSSVYPFVLRGVRLLGVDSTLPWDCETYDKDPAFWKRQRAERLRVWKRLSEILTPDKLELLHAGTVSMEEVPAVCEKLLKGQIRGRMVVRTA